MSTTALGPGGEFDAIRTMLDRWGARASGIGDDAAVFASTRGDQLVASVDSAIEGRHFRRGWLTAREIGYRAVAAALSDLAAMAATPVGILVALGVPDAWRGELARIADGIGDALDEANTVIRGGNVTSASELSITTTVFGAAFAPLLRAGVRAGDTIYVTGKLGAAAAALRSLESSIDAGVHRARFARPVPRIREARWLAQHGATAAIDVSDGLLGDLRHLAAASGVAIAVDVSRVPCADGVDIETALVSGEEYELVVSASKPLDVDAFRSRFGLSLTAIGSASAASEPGIRVVGARDADAKGYDHFSH
jgi:thiamine-monophosphate kinase